MYLPSRYSDKDNENAIKNNSDISKLEMDLRSTNGDQSTKIAPESDRGDLTKRPSKKLIEEGGTTKKKRRKTTQSKKKLVMNIAQTKYYVVRYVGKTLYKMKLTRSEEEDWDVCWQDGAVSCE